MSDLMEIGSVIDFLSEPIIVLGYDGDLLYKNVQAKNIDLATVLKFNDSRKLPIISFFEQEKEVLKNGGIVKRVEILDLNFEEEFYELKISFNVDQNVFLVHFKVITKKVQLENQIALNQAVIEDHIEELTSANDVLKRQNTLIHNAQEEAKAGLRYGKIIQDRINANTVEFLNLFANSYTFYKPQNYIGGDLIWAQQSKLGKIVAVVDCMGHGVPGAMLAMSVFHFLNSTLNNNQFESVSDFLCEVIESYYKSFFQMNQDKDFADTFDISICAIDEASGLLRYRGIKQNILIQRGDQQTEFKGDRVAISEKEAVKILLKEPWDKVWPYKKGDQVFLFSDGFSDQFGGVRNKKYKYLNFKKLIKNNSVQPMNVQRTLLDNALFDWQNTYHECHEQTDDITVVGIQL